MHVVRYACGRAGGRRGRADRCRRRADAGLPLPYCASVSAAGANCADFDNGTIPNTLPWELITLGGASARLVTECGPTNTRSSQCLELAGTQLLVPVGDVGSTLRRNLTGPPRRAAASFAAQVMQVSAGRFDLVSVVMRKANGDRWVLEAEVDAARKLELAEYVIPEGGAATELRRQTAPKLLPFGEWHRVEVLLAVNGTATSEAELRLDGNDVAKLALTAHGYETFAWIELGDRQLDVGVSAQGRFDDVLVTVEPP